MASLSPIFGQAYRLLCVITIIALLFSLTTVGPTTGQDVGVDTIAAKLERALSGSTDAIVLAGDSHAALAATAIADCSTPVIDAGVRGASSEKYLKFLDGFPQTPRLKAVFVFIGTNDANRKREVSITAFKGNAEKIVSRFSRASEKIIVSAVPPISKDRGDKFDADKSVALSNVLSEVCGSRPNCTFIDPHAEYRDPGNSGEGSHPYLSGDGIHLSNYATLRDKLGICQKAIPAAYLE
jgi:lysophospholipase L1-like esterase